MAKNCDFGPKYIAIIQERGLFSMKKLVSLLLVLALTLGQILFLLVYIWVDSAGVRPFSFNAIRFAVSLAGGILVSMLTLGLLAPDPRR